MATNIWKNVTINDQEYVIRKFDAMTGLKLARLVIAKAAPIIPLLDIGDDQEGGQKRSAKEIANDERIYTVIGEVLGTMSDADIDDLVKKCLSVCYVDFPAGKQPIIDETGHYGVDDVEYDMTLTIRLCFEAIKWGAADFFSEKSSPLRQLMK
ncbi:MAG: hypothetical protein IJ769_07785 [Clostridia bacterium]|nr:hypothetical protein [Clostridia bacterium]